MAEGVRRVPEEERGITLEEELMRKHNLTLDDMLPDDGYGVAYPTMDEDSFWSDYRKKEEEVLTEYAKQTDVWEEVMNDPSYSDIQQYDSRVASEVLSRLTGRLHGKMSTEEARKLIADKKETADADTLIKKIKMILNDICVHSRHVSHLAVHLFEPFTN